MLAESTKTAAAGAAPALRARAIGVRFGSVAALTAVDLDVLPGKVHALVGENGAGKSTLLRVCAGAVSPVSGTLELDGRSVVFRSPRDAQRAGVRLIHQELSLVPALSVAENIFLGREPRRVGIVDRGAMRRRAREVLDILEEAIDPDVPVGHLPLARREIVEIAKALAGGSADAPGGAALRVLLLDEPTAILSVRETTTLFERIRTLTARGVAVVYCSHRLDEIDAIADEVSVLRDGARVAHGDVAAMPHHRLIPLMVGRAVEARHRGPRERSELGRELLRIETLRTTAVRDATLTLRAGEIVALVGLVGAGRTELARAIIGADPRVSGLVLLEGREFRPSSPADAVRAGIGYVPEDRKVSGIIAEASTRVNLTLARMQAFAKRGPVPVIERARERRVAEHWIERLRVRTPGPETPIARLSGGNQQKIVVGRWLLEGQQPLRALIVDEPTRGVDVGARAELYGVLRQLAASGVGVLAITSDLEEARDLADRLLVMREGQIVGEFDPATSSAADVVARMMPGGGNEQGEETRRR